MEYSRIKLDVAATPFDSMEGWTFYQRPELPKFEFRANKVKYTFTDLRLLNPAGISAFEAILQTVANTPNCEEVSFNIKGLDEDTINITTDIVLGISYTAKKGGKNGFKFDGPFLVFEASRDEDMITYHLIKDNAAIIYEYAQTNPKPTLLELVIAVADEGCSVSLQWLKKEMKRSNAFGS